MDFVDWRKSPDKITIETENNTSKPRKYYGKAYSDYIDEQIREAQERGDFDNLQGTGKPLHLDENVYAGDKALGYSVLKNNNCAPAEVEMMKEIRVERERAEKKLAKIIHQGKTLRLRRVSPSRSEKRAFNLVAQKAGAEYEDTLRDLNRKILTANLIVPLVMQQSLLEIEPLVAQFRESCPLFDGV